MSEGKESGICMVGSGFPRGHVRRQKVYFRRVQTVWPCRQAVTQEARCGHLEWHFVQSRGGVLGRWGENLLLRKGTESS